MEQTTSMRRLAAGDEPGLGAQVVIQRHGYRHYGIYAGHGWIVHYAGWSRSLRRGPVQQVSLAQFAGGREVWVLPRGNARYTGEDVVRRARSRLGENRYRVTTNNCEHFCAWCVTGESRSEQIERWLGWPRGAIETALGILRALLYAPAAAGQRMNQRSDGHPA